MTQGWCSSLNTEADAPGAPGRERSAVFAVALAACLVPLNSTMVIVALGHITDDFDSDLTASGWLVTGYLIAVAALQTPAGKLGDRLGHRRLFLGGLVAFLATSMAAAAAPNLALLVVFRTGQGVAGAVFFPNGWALLRHAVPVERRARSFGMVGACLALSAATGPPLGDAAVNLASWRAVFALNLVFVLPALVLGRRVFSDEGEAPPSAARPPFDLAGTIAWVAVLLGAAFVLNVSIRSHNLLAALVGGPVVVAGAVAFVRRELRHPDPVLQPRFFAHPAFAAVNAAIGLSNLAMYVSVLAVPFILERDAGGPGPGVVLAVPPVITMVVAPLGGRLADRIGRRLPALCGLTLSAASAVPLALTAPDVPVGLLITCLSLSGVGMGLASAAMQTTALESVAPEASGAASGVYATSRYLGSIVGSSVLAAVPDPAGTAVFGMVLAAAVLAALAVTRIPAVSRPPGDDGRPPPRPALRAGSRARRNRSHPVRA